MKPSGVYAIENKVVPGIYVGSTVNIPARWQSHRRHLRNGTHHNVHLQRAWNKYGESAFELITVDWCDVDEARSLEQSLLDGGMFGHPHCYNAAASVDGPTAGRRLSEEHKRKIGAANAIALKGRSPSESTRRKLSAAMRGQPARCSFSAATRLKMSLAKLGKPAIHNRKPKSAIAKARISATKKGVPWSAARRAAQKAVQL